MKTGKLILLIGLTSIIPGILGCSTSVEKGNIAGKEIVYQVTDGACGKVFFEENIGTDSTSAVEAVKNRKIERFGHDNFTIESNQLKVINDQGDTPEADFYALSILDERGLHLHSVSEVITSEGDLYNLSWCAD